MKYVLIVFSFIELVIVIIYNIVIKKYYTTQQKAKGTFSEVSWRDLLFLKWKFLISSDVHSMMQHYSMWSPILASHSPSPEI